MAKISRSGIKSIVKECLIEILEEGISPSSTMMSESRSSTPTRSSRSRRQDTPRANGRGHVSNRRPALDNMRVGGDSGMDSAINQAASNMTSDPVLSSIFADTARTTLQEQFGAERSGPGGTTLPTAASGDQFAREMSVSDPSEVFSESSSKWAHLAFSENKNQQ